MDNFRKITNAGNLNRSARKRERVGVTSFNFEYLLIVGAIIIFLVRAIGVINSHNENSSYKYVKMLNIGMPIVETQVYNKGEYVEKKLPLKDLVLETLGLSNINLTRIIGSEISYLKNAVVSNEVYSEHNSGFDSFKVNENTIAKLTLEEIAELNDVSKAYNPSLKKELGDKPEVLIYHTHTMEQYAEAGNSQTTNSDANIVGVGEILAKELEEGYGISVVHDKTNYTIADYTTAYDRSREGLQKYLKEYGDFDIIIDLHRDAVEDKNLVTTTLNNQSLAKFMFVTSQNVPTYDANQKIVDELYNIGSTLFPELIKPTKIFEGLGGINGFNQGFSEGSMIIEVGSHKNAAQEAKLTSKYIARIIAEYLNGPK